MQLRIATRTSQMALYQANWVKDQLQALYPELTISLLPMLTTGDKIQTASLAKVGGKGLFLKELESALLEKRADIAVHSLKDIPVKLPQGLILAAFCERTEVRDAWVGRAPAACHDTLPAGAVIGTSSLRRQSFLRHALPQFEYRPLRGNVNTRLAKLDAGEYDAIILSAVGLERVDLAERITTRLSPQLCLPAVGQGGITIECRETDPEIQALLKPLDHLATRQCITAERSLNAALEGGCQVPIGAYATLDNDVISLEAWVGTVDGADILKAQAHAPVEQAYALGQRVAAQLNDLGAREILHAIYHND